MNLHIVCSTQAIFPRAPIFEFFQSSLHCCRIRDFLSLGLRFLAHDPEDSGRAEKVGSEPLEVDGTLLRVSLSHCELQFDEDVKVRG